MEPAIRVCTRKHSSRVMFGVHAGLHKLAHLSYVADDALVAHDGAVLPRVRVRVEQEHHLGAGRAAWNLQ